MLIINQHPTLYNTSAFTCFLSLNIYSCEWTAITERPPKKIPRHIPLHVRKKMKEKLPPKFFEVIPSSGVLQPGDSSNIMVTFMPSEEVRIFHVLKLFSSVEHPSTLNFIDNYYLFFIDPLLYADSLLNSSEC